MPTVKFVSKRSISFEAKRINDNRQKLFENVPLETGKKYAILVRAHVDQVCLSLPLNTM